MWTPKPDKWGGKDNGPQYDPQVAAAANQEAGTAAKAEAFSEDYFNKYIAPLLTEQGTISQQQADNENKLFNLNFGEAQQQNDRYQKFGIPAEDAYYNMVKNYSAPEYQEQQAQAAIGDQRTAALGQRQTMLRQMSAMGIDPSSPAAVAAMADTAVTNAAQEASAANRARQAAKTLGMQLTSDAANFGRGATSVMNNSANLANSNSATASSNINQSVGAASGAASPVMQGFGIGANAYGNVMSNYTDLQKASLAQQGAAASGLGNFLGTVAGAAITHYSDRRLKKNIVGRGKKSNGLYEYEFQYVWQDDDAPKTVGYMADEVQKLYPEAVDTDAHGYMVIDYSKVPS